MSAGHERFAPGGALQGPLFQSLLRRLSRAPRELAAGQTVGPYRILEPLGRGGMAVVYLAERADGEFEQRVALKLITAERESRAARETLRRERQILASLQHPHIARLLDGGSTEDGLLWFAMEPIRGTRIDETVRARALSLPARLRLFLQVVEAVRFAHARLLIHRDLKPSNILVTDEGEAKLLDFGIAIDTADLEQRPLPALTPGFASPEQRRGEALTTASDIWQLGKLLQLLCADLAPSPDLLAIVARAGADDPGRRYGSAGELAEEVQRLLEQRPVQARNGGWSYRAALFLRRHRGWSAAVAALSLLALGGAALFTWGLAAERDARAREAERANAATAFVVELFRGSDPAESGGRALDAQELLAQGMRRLGGDLADQPALRARLLGTIGKIQLALGEPLRARPLFDEAVRALRDDPGEDGDTSLAEALQGRGAVLLELGDPMRAEEALTESAALLGGESSAARRQRGETLNLLSMAQVGAGRYAQAVRTQREALALLEAERGPDSLETAAALENLGIALRANGGEEERLAVLGRAWSIYLAVQGPERTGALHAEQLYALALLDAGRRTEARPLLQEVVERRRVIFHGRGTSYAGALRSLAQLNAAEGDYQGAIDNYLRAAALYADSTEASSTTMGWTLSSLGDCYEALGEYEPALDSFQRALQIRRRLLDPEHLTIAQALDGVSRQLLRLGQSTAAEESARESLLIRWTAQSSTRSPELARTLVPLGAARWAQGDRSEAEALWAHALALIAAAEGRDSPRYRAAERSIAELAPQR